MRARTRVAQGAEPHGDQVAQEPDARVRHAVGRGLPASARIGPGPRSPGLRPAAPPPARHSSLPPQRPEAAGPPSRLAALPPQDAGGRAGRRAGRVRRPLPCAAERVPASATDPPVASKSANF